MTVAAPLPALQVLSPAPRPAWERAVAADPTAFVTQRPQWLDALRSARGGQDASRLYVLPDGRELVLPMVGRTCAGVRLAEESWPYGWGYGGLLVPGGRLSKADCALVLGDLARRPVLRAAVVPVPLAAAPWSAAAPDGAQRVPYRTHVVDLQGGFDAVFSRYSKSTRNLVRKVERSSPEVRREYGGDIVGTSSAMYARASARWARLRGQPAAVAVLWSRYQDRAGQVAAVAAAMGESCVFWSAWRAGEPVAVLVVLQHGDSALSWLTAIDRTLADDTAATYLLQSLALQEACSRGARHFHLGESDTGSGVELYKTKFGARPVTYEALRLERLPLTRAEHRLRRTAAGVARHRLSTPTRKERP